MKYLHVVGNRPQFIKLMPFMRATKSISSITNTIVHSGQHYDYEMSKIFFDQLDLPEVNYNLNVGSVPNNVQIGRMLEKINDVLDTECPDIIIVYGDTNTTLAGALAGYMRHIPVVHVESGMREYIWRPEEINKKMADHCAEFCFCPIERATKNLINEGIDKDRILNVGDITYDAFLLNKSKAQIITSELKGIESSEYIVMTMHRAETVEMPQRASSVIAALEKLNYPIIYPIHPRTSNALKRLGLYERLVKIKNLTLIKPLGYLEFLTLLLHAKLVITDSSGVLKEAFYAQKLCVTVDETTEYKEIFDLGWNKLVGFETDNILAGIEERWKFRISDSPDIAKIFGDGHAAIRMVDIIEDKLSEK